VEVIVLSDVMRIKRTLDGNEIDKIIWDVKACKGVGSGTLGWQPLDPPSKRF
jgi:hypothetical protein